VAVKEWELATCGQMIDFHLNTETTGKLFTYICICYQLDVTCWAHKPVPSVSEISTVSLLAIIHWPKFSCSGFPQVHFHFSHQSTTDYLLASSAL